MGSSWPFGLPHKYNYDFAFHEFFWNQGKLICSLGPTVDDFRVAVDLISSGVIAVAISYAHLFHSTARRRHSHSSRIALTE